MEAAIPESQSCGDVNCIMCYNQVYEFSFPNGPSGNILIYCNMHYPNGTIFCRRTAGTGRNSPDKTPYPVFGSAKQGGNCMSQFQVKDW